jgi:hypothetical protein
VLHAASLRPLFQACDQSALGHLMRDVAWLFPFVETVHLLALGLLGGTVLIVDLRLCGAVLRQEPVSRLARETEPWTIGGLAAMLISGLPLFFSEALKLYTNGTFRMKMILLVLAATYTFTAHRRLVLGDEPPSPMRGRMAALVSLALWSGVGLCGRAIGFLGT